MTADQAEQVILYLRVISLLLGALLGYLVASGLRR